LAPDTELLRLTTMRRRIAKRLLLLYHSALVIGVSAR
jgi:hypothetical protein